MDERSKSENALVFSYLAHRKTIGILGIALPFVVSLGALLLFQTELQRSISSYYHTDMRSVFVGTLWALGIFLISYKGHKPVDDMVGHLGGIAAVGMALFPTTYDDPCAGSSAAIGTVHVVFAGLFFLTLIYFSLFLFTKTDPDKSPSKRKLQRNLVYRVCGYTMSLCIALIAIFFLLPDGVKSSLKAYKPVFWLEALAIVAFGISWFTKGEAILKDEVEAHD